MREKAGLPKPQPTAHGTLRELGRATWLPDTHSRPPHFATAQRRFAGGPTHWCPPPGAHPIADARSRGSPFAKFLNFRNQQREERSRTLRRTSSDDGETFQSSNGRAILTTRRLRKAADYEFGGQEFESLRARHEIRVSRTSLSSLRSSVSIMSANSDRGLFPYMETISISWTRTKSR